MTITTSDTRTHQPGGEATRLPGTPVFIQIGNENGNEPLIEAAQRQQGNVTQLAAGQRVTTREGTRRSAREWLDNPCAGYHESEKRGNHAQVVVVQDAAIEMSHQMGEFAGNLQRSPWPAAPLPKSPVTSPSFRRFKEL